METVNTKPTIYFISGLGANEKAFHFLDLSFCNPVFLPWLTHQKDQSLHHYAMRLMELIPEEAPNVVGLSFGGMLATEIALAKPKAKVFLISSNKTTLELPPYFKLGKYLPLYKLVPNNIMKGSSSLFMWLMSAEGRAQKEILLQMARETDMKFAKWAVSSIVTWENKITPQNIVHVHGNADKLLPFKYVSKPDYTIKKGKHSMVMDQADEISSLLKQYFRQ